MTKGIRSRLARCLTATALAGATLLLAAGAQAQTTVRLMHVEANPAYAAIWRQLADTYQNEHPGVTVELQFLENEAFKAKLPTLLQSNDAPDLFYSWTGGVLKAQREAGAVQDLTAPMQADGGAWAKSYLPAAVDGVTIDDQALCVPLKMSMVGFFYNKALFEKAGVDGTAIRTWDDFMGAVGKLKAAGVTPIAGGGGDKWPLHFYWSYLALRLGGEPAFTAAKAGENGGFTAEPFVQAFAKLKELGAAEPFQAGYLGTRWQDTLALFGDGRAAMLLTFDDSANRQAKAAADGKGIPRDQLGTFAFPVVDGGAGAPEATFGGVNCWAVSRNAKPEAIDFARWFTSEAAEKTMAENGMLIPAAAGAQASLTDPIVKGFAEQLARSPFHQLFLDQDLGPSVGRVVNDVTVEVVSGQMEPEEAAQEIQDAFELQ
ncbi:extracellular solute-binding protein [Aureimonas jatrophae]|uniref:Carbohydrate ABC transporter substrate-binding protein, CUT1 family n=1 Tax=Aureimonas jatrophae TaxID=1166073 RepID=A0A1H0F692_9HYPH|nr:extracellular solute-binding protein [Aureimonas jatrophae]MBB3950158.1 raffinose/stachyose/melibiose transport system substrate-binding protein [Aureimonas jatrophae]SDN90187.1 carbohydrate ABC transporter substrate-binding protein, CUT1 family [Aureimonas jatrophae]